MWLLRPGGCRVSGHLGRCWGAAKPPEFSENLAADLGCLFSGPGRSERTCRAFGVERREGKDREGGLVPFAGPKSQELPRQAEPWACWGFPPQGCRDERSSQFGHWLVRGGRRSLQAFLGDQGSGVWGGPACRTTTTATCPAVCVSSGRVMWEILGKLVSAGWMVSRYVRWGALPPPSDGAAPASPSPRASSGEGK